MVCKSFSTFFTGDFEEIFFLTVFLMLKKNTLEKYKHFAVIVLNQFLQIQLIYFKQKVIIGG